MPDGVPGISWHFFLFKSDQPLPYGIGKIFLPIPFGKRKSLMIHYAGQPAVFPTVSSTQIITIVKGQGGVVKLYGSIAEPGFSSLFFSVPAVILRQTNQGTGMSLPCPGGPFTDRFKTNLIISAFRSGRAFKITLV